MPSAKKKTSKKSKKKPKKVKAPERKIDLTEHFLVPKHRILSPEEAEELLRRYGVTRQQLPYILVSDPIVKALGAKPGDILEIMRESETAGVTRYYRVVVRSE